MVSSNNKIVSSRFFEQSQFEQFTMSLSSLPHFRKNGRKFFWKMFKMMNDWDVFAILKLVQESKNFLLQNIFVSDHRFGYKQMYQSIIGHFSVLATLFFCWEFCFIFLFESTLLPCLWFLIKRITNHFTPKSFKNCLGDVKDDSPLFRKKSVIKFPSLQMTHNHNTRAKALVSGGCATSKEINIQKKIIFLNNMIPFQIFLKLCQLQQYDSVKKNQSA